MISTANKVVSIALSYVGCSRGSAKHKELIKAFNSVKPHGYTAKVSDAWCAIAWSAWQILAGNTQSEVPMSCNCGQIITDAKKLGIWVENDGFKPSKGDAILYDWEDSGNGDNTGTPNHIGMVYDVDDKWIYVVEGNKGSSSTCGKRAIAINGKYIRGFVHPHYQGSQDVTKVTVDGQWGYMTTLLSQKVMKTYQDGIVSGQRTSCKKYLPNALTTSWEFTKSGNGSQLIRTIQKLVGASIDGIMGKDSVTALQIFLRDQGIYTDKIDGIMGSNTVKAWQRWINNPTYIVSNKSKLVSKAQELAWPKGTASSKYAWDGGSATEAFKKAIDKVYPNRSKWSIAPRKGCCCDVFVGTCVRASGLDGKFPRGFDEQWEYTSKAFEKIVKKGVTPKSVSQDGDIILYKKGDHKHVLLRGNGFIYEAQYKKTYGHVNTSLSKIDKVKDKIVIFRAK